MFERYTERALRVLFFTRAAVSKRNSTAIQPEHLLLGLLREDDGLSGSILRPSKDAIENEISADVPAQGKPVAEDEEIPFSSAMKDILHAAQEEANQLHHEHIGDEHLLLGLLSQGTSLAASVLIANGFQLETMRNAVIAASNRANHTNEMPLKGVKGRLETGNRKVDS
jgi:ATP-dependent Clp protease ATP-binding subunit ClpC